MKKYLAIDVRKMSDSGIGTYIRNIVSQLIVTCKTYQFYLLGEYSYLQTFYWTQTSNVKLIDCKSRPFSIYEQIELVAKIPKETHLLWIPHFNLPLFYRGRLLVTIHDLFPLTTTYPWSGVHKKLYAQLMFTALRWKAHKILAVSKFTKKELLRFVSLNPEQIQVILNGVADEWFNIKPLSRPHPKPYILFVGNIKPNKNLKTLVDAYRKFYTNVPHNLIIVGKKEGFITPEINMLDKVAEFTDRIIFTGYVDDTLLKQYYIHADCFVFPSLYEGFGLPVLEAMACGCPVVASSNASLPEIGEKAVLYCNPYSADDMAKKILALITNEALQTQLIQRGKQHARQFSWQNTTEQTKQEIEQLIG